jgi:hypothetical protein
MFITPKIGFISPTHTFVRFQGIHLKNENDSYCIGPDPQSKSERNVYITDDEGNTDIKQPGAHKSRFETIKNYRDSLTNPDKKKEVDELLEQYRESLFSVARKMKSADKNKHSSNKKKILMSAALYGLLLSAALWGEQQGIPK